MSLAYLFDSNIQFQDKSGNNNVNGFLRVYIDNTDDRAVTYKDFNGTLNQADIRLDNNGRAVVIVDDSKTYRLEVYGTTGVLLWTLYPISPKATGINETLEALVAAVKSHTIAIEGLALGKKNKQQAKVISGNTTQTLKSITQDANGEIDVELEDIDFPYNIKINSPDDSIEVGTPVVDPEWKEETIPISVKRPGLVKADSADTEPGTLIDKLEVVDNVRDPQDVPLLSLETTVDGQGNRKVAINEDALKTFSGNVIDSLKTLTELVDELPSGEHGYFNTSLYTTPGDGTMTNLVMGDFRISENRDVHGDSIEFVPTHQEGGVDFGEVWLEPGTYIIATQITLQWVGNPRGTFFPLVANVADQPFDFSYEHEDVVRTTRIITKNTRGKLVVNIAIDADTPPMGVWVKNLEVAQIASINQLNIAHDTTLTGTGKVADPLGVTPAAFGKVKDIPTSIVQFRNGDVIPVDGPNGPAKMDKNDLLKETAQNALADNAAPAFDPSKPNDEGGYSYYAGTSVIYNGKNYVFVVNHPSGAWNPNEVEQKPLSESMNAEGIGESVQEWLDNHPEATTTVENDSITDAKLHSSIKYNRESTLTQLGYCLVSSSSSLASQLIYTNTIYEIRWNFDITGETITIPSGSILKFSGGRIKGGTLVGNMTYIEARGFCLDGVKLEGIFTNEYFSVDWFGVKGDGVTDVTTLLQSVIDNIEPNISDTKCNFTLFFPNGVYCISSEVRLKSFVHIKGCGRNINPNNKSGCTLKLTAPNTAIFRIDGASRNIRFEDVNFECWGTGFWHQNTIAIKAQPLQEADGSGSSKPTFILNCSFMGFSRHLSIERGLKSDGSKKSTNDWQFDNVVISGCSFSYAFDSCIYCETSNGLDYSVIENSGMSLYGDGTEKYCINLVRSGFLRIYSCAFSAVGTLTGTGVINKYAYTGPIVMDSVQGESIYTYGKANGKFSIVNSVFDRKIELTNVTGNFYCNVYNSMPSIVLKNDCKIFTDAERTKIKIEGLSNVIGSNTVSSRGLVDSAYNPLFFPICQQMKSLVSTGQEESVEIFRGSAKRYIACAYKITLKAKMTVNLGGGSYRLVFNPYASGQQTLVSSQTTESEQVFICIANDSANWSDAVLKLFCSNCTVQYSIIIEQLSANSF